MKHDLLSRLLVCICKKYSCNSVSVIEIHYKIRGVLIKQQLYIIEKLRGSKRKLIFFITSTFDFLQILAIESDAFSDRD
jgi:hypothetical protein